MPSCLVALPFGANFERYYKQILSPTILSAGLNPIRTEDIGRPHTFEQISSGMSKAAVCVADLTGQTAGVMYVLGLAQGLGKPVVMLVQSAGELPFDVRLRRHIVYHPAASKWEDMLSLQLQTALRDIVPLSV
jgi:nucleoside 2-deoxyribosyltransferase